MDLHFAAVSKIMDKYNKKLAVRHWQQVQVVDIIIFFV